MIKRFTFVAALLLSISLAKAESVKIGDLYYLLAPTHPDVYEAMVTYSPNDYKGMTEIVIPSTVTYDGTEYTVTQIGAQSFYYCSTLSKISIPSTVHHIGAEAFLGTPLYNDKNNWHDNVCIIDNCIIFSKNRAVTSYNIPEGIRVIADNAFEGSVELRTLTIPSSVIGIGNSSFENAPISELILPPNLRYLGAVAFNGAEITSLTLPSTLQFIGIISFPWNKINERFDLYCHATVPPLWIATSLSFTLLGSSKYSGFNFKSIYAHVPKTALADYRENDAGYWPNFTLAGDITPVENPKADVTNRAKKVLNNGNIYLLSPDGRQYDLLGTEVK